jgi:hypothetical protein
VRAARRRSRRWRRRAAAEARRTTPHPCTWTCSPQVTSLNQVARRRELAAAGAMVQSWRPASELGRRTLGRRIGKVKDLWQATRGGSWPRGAALARRLREIGLRAALSFDNYPRMVDPARELGKEVELTVEERAQGGPDGGEALREPLMHLVRNALDHGLSRGKNESRLASRPAEAGAPGGARGRPDRPPGRGRWAGAGCRPPAPGGDPARFSGRVRRPLTRTRPHAT